MAGEIRWGVIGCGDVCEQKAGPALYKTPRSRLVSVMRRDAAMAEDFARRHNVPRWTSDAEAIIADPEIDAIYVATPPSSHADYAIRAMRAGKHVLSEKPMAITSAECDAMTAASRETGKSLTVAYYRRALPRLEKFRELATGGAIGAPRTAETRHFRPRAIRPAQIWKIDPAVGGGGIFADVQTHTLDWFDHAFGPARDVKGFKMRQAGDYEAEDLVAFVAKFGDVAATGIGSYASSLEEERVIVTGDEGRISMSFYSETPIVLERNGAREEIVVADPPHVHGPLVEKIIAHLLDGAPNPCPGEAAGRAVAMIETIYG